MVDNAQNSKKLYEEMRRAGYEDSEFPAWWHSPARSEGEVTQVTEVKTQQTEVKTQQTEVKTQQTEVKTQQSEITEVLDEVPPRAGPL
jgi:hypothetical protein